MINKILEPNRNEYERSRDFDQFLIKKSQNEDTLSENF